MKQELSELVFILDKSGSMNGKEEDVIGGFNSTIKKERDKERNTLVTTVLFSDDQKIVHDRVKLSEINNMTSDDYKTNGCTALIDAIGDTIKHISNIHKYVENKPDCTMFIIMTDGMENASTKYSSDEVKKMIGQQKEKGWEFIFMGANIDAVETAKRYGIAENRVASYSTKNMTEAYEIAEGAVHCYFDTNLPIVERVKKLDKGKWKK